MDQDSIAEIGIDNNGRLYVMPLKESFPYIYREAMEIHWDVEGRYLYAPPPPRAKLETPFWWFRQILSAAREQGCALSLTPQTTWQNISQELKEEITSSQGAADA